MQILTQAFLGPRAIVSDSVDSMDEGKLAETVEDLIPKVVANDTRQVNEGGSAGRFCEDASRKEGLVPCFQQKQSGAMVTSFDPLETFIVICTEAGENFNNSYRLKAVTENDVVFDAVVRHHARACHIAQEIICLLKSGFADGRMLDGVHSTR